MKKIFLISFLILTLAIPGYAFLYNIDILAKEEIVKLSNDDLSERYIEAKIEEKASAEFHEGAGFSSAKEYEKRKALLRYIFELRREMGKRENLDPQEVDDYLQ